MTARDVLRMLRYGARACRQELRAQRDALTAWQRFWRSYHQYRKLAPHDAQTPLLFYPCLGDDGMETPVEATYFYQDAWAFEKIVQQQASQSQLVEHVDVGSHHKFVALLSKVAPVTMVDIRPLPVSLNTLNFKAGSILQMPYADGSVGSLSSLCVVEHIGLGRYGDPLDWRGTEKAIGELKRIIAPGGNFYLSLPLDDENRIYFNAHRAFTEDYVMGLLAPFEIIEKRYIWGHEFLSERRAGFGTGCYHVRRPL